MFCSYRAINLTGEKIDGKCYCNSKMELIKTLRSRGYYLTNYAELKNIKRIGFNKLKAKDIIIFTSQVSSLLAAGINISEAIHLVGLESSNKQVKKSLIHVEKMINQGMELSESLRIYNNIFPNFLINMIKIGEESGRLGDIFNKLYIYYNNENTIRSKIIKALVYPCLLFVVSVIVLYILITTVIPVFKSTLLDLGGNLPESTNMILKISSIISENLLFIFLIMILITIILIRVVRNENIKLLIHKFIIRNIVTGKFTKKVMAVRFSRIVGILIGSGIQIVSSIDTASNMIGNQYAKNQIKKCLDSIKKGENITQSITNTNLFPVTVYSMIRIGEESGNLEEMLFKVSSLIEEELYNSIEKITTLLQPTIILILSFFIGGILMSLVLPMFNIMSSF